MFLGKNNENIYGYTGKRSPSFNFASSSIQGTYKKVNDNKQKQQVVIKTEKPKDLFIKTVLFSQSVNPGAEFILFSQEEAVNSISTNENVDTSLLINKTIHCKIGVDIVFEFVLLAHEKGISVKTNSFLVHPVLKIQEDSQLICFSSPDSKIKVVETKFSFKNPEFPFYYKYETNPKYDDIFNDFIESNLAEIKPPSNVTVVAKHTQSEISYRQYISYIKTRTLMNFKVDVSGWYIDSFTEVDSDVDACPAGIIFRPLPYWTFHPGGQRIEHLLQFQ